MQRSWQRKTKSQPCRKPPVWRGMANSPPNPRIDEDVFPWRFPDKAEESGIIRSVSSNALSVDFPHQPQFWTDGQLPNHSPDHKGIVFRSIYSATDVHVIRYPGQLSTPDPVPFE